MPPAGLPPLEMPAAGSSSAPDLPVTPSRELQPMPSQTVIPPNDTPGAMGTPNQGPSPM
jgi:hypothetical protein